MHTVYKKTLLGNDQQGQHVVGWWKNKVQGIIINTKCTTHNL